MADYIGEAMNTLSFYRVPLSAYESSNRILNFGALHIADFPLLILGVGAS
jgi:hypothetical protein